MSTATNPGRAGVFLVPQLLLETALAVKANQGGEILRFNANVSESGVRPVGGRHRLSWFAMLSNDVMTGL